MVKARLILLTAGVLLAASCQYQYSWPRYKIDGHRTGVGVPTADNVVEALGTVDDSLYHAPNGTSYPKGSATYAAAEELIVP